jgi:hypothetical protein
MAELTFWLNVLAVPGLFITGALLTLTVDWRASFTALLGQYVFAAVLLAQTVPIPVAAVYGFGGVIVVAILMLTGRQVNYARGEGPARDARTLQLRLNLAELRRIRFQTNLPFRGVAVLLATAVAGYLVLGQGVQFPGVPMALTFGGALLVALGLLTLGFTEEPMNAGMGLLMLLTGFGLIYLSVERSVAVVALLAGLNFGLAIAVSYLALLRYASVNE